MNCGSEPGSVYADLRYRLREGPPDVSITALPAADRHAQRSGIIMARIYLTLLDEMERDGFRVLEHRVALTPLRKLWIAWRTARAEERQRRRLARAA